MRRVIADIAAALAASAVIGGFAFAVGTALVPAAPEGSPTDAGAATSSGTGGRRCLDAPIESEIGATGRATLCLTGTLASISLLATGLEPGATYAVWLQAARSNDGGDATSSPASGSAGECLAALCTPAVPADPRPGLFVPLGNASAGPVGIFVLDAEAPDTRVAPGDVVTLLVLRPGGRAGPHARARIQID